MKISEYIHKKQELLEAEGVTTILTPEDQIDDTIKQVSLVNDCPANICPYCLILQVNLCKECPMAKADNRCAFNNNNTYFQVNTELKRKSITEVKGMQELVDRYNKELEDG